MSDRRAILFLPVARSRQDAVLRTTFNEFHHSSLSSVSAVRCGSTTLIAFGFVAAEDELTPSPSC